MAESIDSAKGLDNLVLPFTNVINSFYARQASTKTRAGVPVKGLAPVITLIVIRIVLVEVGLRIENSLFPQDLCHPHIADAISEHTKDVPHHIRCRWVNDQVMTAGAVQTLSARSSSGCWRTSKAEK